jgi:opacity protein-like surface antigen
MAFQASRIKHHVLILILALPASAHGEKTFSLGVTASNPRGDFATGWHEGAGLEGRLTWPYWRAIHASVSLSLLNHPPRASDDPEVLLGVWTLGVHWKPRVSQSLEIDFMFGAQHHTAVFHDGLKKFEGNKGFNESDLGWCFGTGLETAVSERWSIELALRANVVFSQPEWARYETLRVGITHGSSP